MTDKQVAMWLVIMLVIESAAIVAGLVFALSGKSVALPVMVKMGLLFLIAGLVVQIVRSVHYLNAGAYPVDRVFPLWIAKDLGASILIFYYASHAWAERHPKKPAAKPRRSPRK